MLAHLCRAATADCVGVDFVRHRKRQNRLAFVDRISVAFLDRLWR